MTTTQNGTTSQLEVIVSLDELTIGDLRTLDRGEKQTGKALVTLLDRVVVGGARHLPLRSVRAIGEQLKVEMEALTRGADEVDGATVIDLPAEVTVDVDQLTIGDLELLDGGDDRSTDDLIALLDRVVIGRPVEELSVKYFVPISTALRRGIESMNDLGN